MKAMIKNIRKTDYENGAILEIIECTFHPYKLGEKVKILNKYNNVYHVVNLSDNNQDQKFYWVTENQIKKT